MMPAEWADWYARNVYVRLIQWQTETMRFAELVRAAAGLHVHTGETTEQLAGEIRAKHCGLGSMRADERQSVHIVRETFAFCVARIEGR
jgi:hypothetical protein